MFNTHEYSCSCRFPVERRKVFKNRRTIYYRGRTFQSLKARGFKSNYFCVETGEDYWISGPKRRGGDALYGGSIPIEIDEDEREEYWRDIRQQPDRVHDPSPDPPCWKGELPRAPLLPGLHFNGLISQVGLAVARPSREAGMLLEICRSGGRRCGWIRAGCRSDSKPQHIPARCGWSGDTAAVRFVGRLMR